MASFKKPQYSKLLHMLSAKPPATCISERINFTKVGLPVFQNCFAMAIHDALSADECAALLNAAQETNQWEQALVNTGHGNQALYTDVRLSERIIWDDADVSARILDRVMPHLPDDIKVLQNRASITGNGPVKRKETWKISRLNERLRVLKYTKGCYFRIHCDGSYATPGNEEITFITVHLYLNDANDNLNQLDGDDASKPLVGGATRFFGYNEKDVWDFNPKKGAILVFQHRDLLHSGEDVLQGTKYTVRSDILYRKVVEEDEVSHVR